MPGQTKSAKVITQDKKADRSRSKSTTRAQAQKVAQPEKKATAPAQKKVAKKTEVSPVRETRSKKVAPTKSKPLLSKSVDEAKLLSDSESSDTEVAYKAGDLVAFVDKNDAEEGKMVISIGKVSVFPDYLIGKHNYRWFDLKLRRVLIRYFRFYMTRSLMTPNLEFSTSCLLSQARSIPLSLH